MSTILEFLRRLRFLFSRSRFDQDMAEEMRLHLDLRAASKAERGMPPQSAALAARRQFGNLTQVQENSREAWTFAFLETLLQDLRYGLRNLAANPAFTATAVASLALGIGANTAIFSIINTLMLRTLPVADPQALVQIQMGTNDDGLNTPIWEQVRDHQQAFAGVLAYAPDRFDLSAGGESHYAEGIWASGSFFDVLGVPPLLGRTFNTADDRWGGGPAGAIAVISYAFWQRAFPGDPNVIGKTIHLNRLPFTIVGVTPPWFTGLNVDHGYDVAIPIGTEPMFRGDGPPMNELQHWWLRLIGRLAPGQTLQQAGDRMRAIAPEIFKATAPPFLKGHDQQEYLNSQFLLTPAALGFSELRVQYRTALLALMVTVGLVLLIACANIANLLLARASARQRELSVRMAIGAGRLRLIRQLLTESLLLSLFGAAGGFLLAAWGSSLLFRQLSTTGSPLDLTFSANLRLLAFTMGSAVLTALLFGLLPALRATRGLNNALKENERGTLGASHRFQLGKTLVSVQVALSLVLLVGAGLFLGTLRNLLTVDPGFDRHNILLVGTTLRNTTSPQQRLATYREIRGRLESLPGVVSAANSMLTPINPAGWAQPVFPEGFTPKSRGDNLVFFNRVSAGYFKTMRTPVLMGREFNDHDTLTAPLAIIVNETAARRFFGASNPIGRTIGLEKHGAGRNNERDLYQVVGVVKDTRYNRINESQRAIAYLAGEQDPQPGASLRFSVQSRGPVESIIPAVRAAIGDIDPTISLEFSSFETQVSESLLQPRLVATLSAMFGALALILAMVGLYGVTSYSVARRKSEIGIRIALGAQGPAVVWLMLRDVVVLLSLGMAVGIGASLALGRLVTSLLYGVQPNAPAQLAGAAAVLALATALAAWLPARRAARLDPMVALREE